MRGIVISEDRRIPGGGPPSLETGTTSIASGDLRLAFHEQDGAWDRNEMVCPRAKVVETRAPSWFDHVLISSMKSHDNDVHQLRADSALRELARQWVVSMHGAVT